MTNLVGLQVRLQYSVITGAFKTRSHGSRRAMNPSSAPSPTVNLSIYRRSEQNVQVLYTGMQMRSMSLQNRHVWQACPCVSVHVHSTVTWSFSCILGFSSSSRPLGFSDPRPLEFLDCRPLAPPFLTSFCRILAAFSRILVILFHCRPLAMFSYIFVLLSFSRILTLFSFSRSLRFSDSRSVAAFSRIRVLFSFSRILVL